ncbi:MAG: VWA domain-containing protein, partial [Myxococcota bacterium]
MRKTIALFATALALLAYALLVHPGPAPTSPSPLAVRPAPAPFSSPSLSDPVAVTLVLDRSGSMSGARLEQLRVATKALLAELRDQDRVALVTYGSDHRIDLPLVPVGPNRGLVVRVLDGLVEGGASHLSAGLAAGLRVLASAPDGHDRRLILVTDGGANQGLTRADHLETLVRAGHRSGIELQTLGIGSEHDRSL